MIISFQGEAGTGKTTSLINETKNYVKNNKFTSYQKILALTFMHGSRKRLIQRLSNENELVKRYECSTIDSFANKLLLRWRSVLYERGEIISIGDLTFDSICKETADLLNEEEVRLWIKRK